MTFMITIDYESLRPHCTGYAQEGKIAGTKKPLRKRLNLTN